MSAPRFNILTSQEVYIDLSRPAMLWILEETGRRLVVPLVPDGGVQCEVDNFRNLLQNLLERSEPEFDAAQRAWIDTNATKLHEAGWRDPRNLDLIGE